MATFFVIASLAMVGLPHAERLRRRVPDPVEHLHSVSRGWAIAATVGVILGATYMLWLVQRIFYGPRARMAATAGHDLRLRRMVALRRWPF